MGSMPFMKSMISKSTYEIGKCAMPSFTNVNNMSIVTGTTPDVHGICGNFFFNPDDGKETLMNDDSFLRVSTIFEAFENGLGVTRTEFGLAIGIQMLFWGIFAPIFGFLADKFSKNHKVPCVVLSIS